MADTAMIYALNGIGIAIYTGYLAGPFNKIRSDQRNLCYLNVIYIICILFAVPDEGLEKRLFVSSLQKLFLRSNGRRS